MLWVHVCAIPTYRVYRLCDTTETGSVLVVKAGCPCSDFLVWFGTAELLGC